MQSRGGPGGWPPGADFFFGGGISPVLRDIRYFLSFDTTTPPEFRFSVVNNQKTAKLREIYAIFGVFLNDINSTKSVIGIFP